MKASRDSRLRAEDLESLAGVGMPLDNSDPTLDLEAEERELLAMEEAFKKRGPGKAATSQKRSEGSE